MAREIQFFQVGIKAFIMNGNRLLMVKGGAIDPRWELPGGRIDVGEELLPATDILRREIREELGSDICVEIGRPVVTWSRQLSHWDKFVYLVGLEAKYLSGGIVLSNEHTDFRWVTEAESRTLSLAENYDRALDEFWKTR